MTCLNVVGQRFVLNDRWLFDIEQDALSDLTGNQPAVALPPILTRILTLFAHAPRQALTRRFLFENGWKVFGFEVCENSLNQVICALRSTFTALDPHRPYFKTIPRIGYCLLVDAHPYDPETSLAPSLPAPIETELLTSANHAPALTVYQRFQTTLEMEWQRARCNGSPLSLLMLDIGALLPDSAREECGREAVRTQISSYLGSHLLRPGDRLVYYSETMLGVLLPDTFKAGAARVAERLQGASAEFDGSGNTARGSAPHLECGIACTDECSADGYCALTRAAINALEHPWAIAEPFGH